MPSISTEMSAVHEEEPPSKQPSTEGVQEKRLNMIALLERLGGDGFERNIALLTAATPENKRKFFERTDEAELEELAALYSLSEDELETLLRQPHPPGFHSKGVVLFLVTQLYELTGDGKYAEVLGKHQDELARH